jgi:hypothetical protein
MKGGAQAALAIGVGYMLGRRRKLRLATMLAVGAAAGGLGPGGALLRRGTQVLGSAQVLDKLSPQLAGLAQTVRDDLLDAGKAAASAAVTSRIDSLSSSLHDRAETLRNPEAAAEGVSDTLRSAGRRRARDGEEEEPEDYAEEEEAEDYEAEEESEPDEAEAQPRRPTASAPRRARPARSQAPGRTRSPVTRAGR